MQKYINLYWLLLEKNGDNIKCMFWQFEHWKEGMELQLVGITNLTGWKNYVTKLITKDGFGQGEKVYFPMM